MGTFLIICFVGFIIYQLYKNENNKSLYTRDNKNLKGQSRRHSNQGHRNLEFKIQSSSYQDSNAYPTQKLSNDPNQFWISEEESIEVKGYNINRGLIYVGKNLSTVESRNYWQEIEPALINPDLPVNKGNPDYAGSSLGYWSSYKGISAEARAAYLEWLESGRKDPQTNIGYVFLYYYGLERRLLHDLRKSSNPTQEANGIIVEIKRLRSIYSKNGSFDQYTQSLLDYFEYKESARDKIKKAFETEERDYTKYGTSYNITLNFKLALAYCALNSIPLPSRLALKWGIHDKYLRTPGVRCKKELQELFSIKYARKFGEGDILKPNKTPIQFNYRPASSTYGYSNKFYFTTDVPDLLRLTAKPNKYYTIVEECIDELDAYSRQLGRGNSPEDIKTLSKLPKELLTSDLDNKFNPYIQEVKSDLLNKNFVLKNSEDIISLWSTDSNSLSKRDSIEIAQFFSKYDIGFEPDARFDNKKIRSNDKIVLFNINSKTAPKKPSKEYHSALTILHLSIVIGLADNVFKVEEKRFLENYIEDIFNLSIEEKKRIHGYLLWLEQSNPSTRGVKSKINTLSSEEREKLLLYLVKLSNADGYIHPKEVEMLQKIAEILEIDSQLVFSLIHSVQSNGDEPVLVKNKDQVQGYGLPKEKNTQELNKDIIRKTLKETEEIQNILGEIFDDDEEEIISAKEITQQDNMIGVPSLKIDGFHSKLLQTLLEKEKWERDEYEKLCAELNLFPEGALEIINEASFEVFDDEMIIDNGVIIINREIMDYKNG